MKPGTSRFASLESNFELGLTQHVSFSTPGDSEPESVENSKLDEWGILLRRIWHQAPIPEEDPILDHICLMGK
jgi:hypothetical protein